MANMTFKANLLPNSNLGYSLGSSTAKWNLYGNLTGNADSATALTSNAGSITQPIYFTGGKPTSCSSTLGVSITGNAATATKATQDADGYDIRQKYVNVYNTANIGSSGQVTFNDLAAAGNAVALICPPTDNPTGEEKWCHALSLCWTKGTTSSWISQLAWGTADANGLWYRCTAGNIVGLAWKRVLDSTNYTSYTVTKTGSGASGTWGINITGNADTVDSLHATNFARSQVFQESFNNVAKNYGNCAGMIYTADGAPNGQAWYHYLQMTYNNTPGGGAGTSNYWVTQLASTPGTPSNVWFRSRAGGDTITSGWSSWIRCWMQGNSVTGAVWNDYAEYRESTEIQPGYVVFENGDDTLSPTSERLQHFAGVTSDTWGFAQGKTDKAKTPIAVAGRVLVYTYRPREEYMPGDCVCAAPDGTIDIMTREEVREWPDRIVGTVSCVPDYEMWGGGEGADRDPVKVNGRIWIKVK